MSPILFHLVRANKRGRIALSKKECVNRRVKSFWCCFADGALFGRLVDFCCQKAELVIHYSLVRWSRFGFPKVRHTKTMQLVYQAPYDIDQVGVNIHHQYRLFLPRKMKTIFLICPRGNCQSSY